jgi:hypothetical protein
LIPGLRGETWGTGFALDDWLLLSLGAKESVRQKQIPFGNDNKKSKDKDNKKSEGKDNKKSKGEDKCGSFALLRMTAVWCVWDDGSCLESLRLVRR